MIKKHDFFLIRLNRPLFILITVVFGVCLNIILSFFGYYFLGINFEEEVEINFLFSKNLEYILIVFIAPFFETFFFQYLLIVVFLRCFFVKIKRNHITFSLVVSSLLFGSIHIYNFYYFIIATIMGFYFGYITLLSEFFREKRISVFISVFLCHSIINLISLIID